MSAIFLNQLLEPVAKTVFPIITALECSDAWRGALADEAGIAALSAGEDASGLRRSLIPTMFFGGNSFEAEARAALEQSLFSEENVAAVIARVEGAGRPLPDGYSPRALSFELAAINRIIEIYGLGRQGLCSPADMPVCEVSSGQFADDASVALEMVAQSLGGLETLFSVPFRLALALLDVNNFHGLFALEPLEEGINRAAAAFAREVDWARYPYSAIIVPGFGPVDYFRSLSARGRLQVQLAAKHYAEGLAPFIIVSGSRVWPRHTAHRESEELRKGLIERFGIDPKAIIVEPYARHTPSNLRNATRRLAAIGAPLNKETLVVTNDDQLNHMLSDMFEGRCMHELGMLPGRFVGRRSEVSAAFLPSEASLQANPLDPLDP